MMTKHFKNYSADGESDGIRRQNSFEIDKSNDSELRSPNSILKTTK